MLQIDENCQKFLATPLASLIAKTRRTKSPKSRGRAVKFHAALRRTPLTRQPDNERSVLHTRRRLTIHSWRRRATAAGRVDRGVYEVVLCRRRSARRRVIGAAVSR